MPTPYTGNPDNFSDPVDMPDDGDPPDAADVVTPMEALLDDIAALAQGFQSSSIADLTALKAINTTSLADGVIRSVPGYGRFKLDKTVHPTFGEDLPLVVAPTTGTGRWFAQDVEAKVQYVKIFDTAGNTTWQCPPNLALVRFVACGGGGGGGGGYSGIAAGSSTGGGGAGAGAQPVEQLWNPLSGSANTVHVGAGGAGGAGGASGGNAGADGTDGADSYATTGFVQVTAPGGMAGRGATLGSGTAAKIIPGGTSAGRGSPKSLVHETTGPRPSSQPGSGGYGEDFYVAPNGNTAGSYSLNGNAGGAAGAPGATHTNVGGRGGAGGGGGALGAGGAGGTGGDGAASGAGTNGGAGTAAVVNTGGGGGGGGGGGVGSTAACTGGAGGAGGDGQVILYGVS